MSDDCSCRRPLKELEADYGSTRKPSVASSTATPGTKTTMRRSLTPPPFPSDYADLPPSYESLDLHPRTRRNSCPPNPTGIPYLGGGKEFYDAGDYHQLTACVVLACLVFWLFNPLFGIVAFAIAVLGKRWEAEADYDRARRYAKMSCYVSMAGVIVAAIAVCILLTVYLA